MASVPSDLFNMACSRQCGAISMAIAFLGTFCRASWNSTGLRRLLTWYSADEYLARSVSQRDSGIEELIHRDVRGRGSVITWGRFEGHDTNYIL